MRRAQLEIIDLCHKYNSQKDHESILKSINLRIYSGELIGLVGPSGCGKTTLLRLIAGFESPLHGKILLDGTEISNNKTVLPPERRGIGMVFQDYALFPHLTLWKNVCFGIKKKSSVERIHWLLELLGLNNFIERYPHELSGGQRQRLAFARALAPGNSIVLLDEPFNSLDIQVRMRLRMELPEVLKTFSATGIFVTHDSQEALSICDRIAVMQKGKLHQCASPEELAEDPSTSFVGEFVFQRNIFPITFKDNRLFTPLGKYSLSFNSFSITPKYLMFDSGSLELDFTSTPNAIIKSKEYTYSTWIITVKYNDYLIRVSYPIDKSVKVGQLCNLSFKANQQVILFPGCHKAKLSAMQAN